MSVEVDGLDELMALGLRVHFREAVRDAAIAGAERSGRGGDLGTREVAVAFADLVGALRSRPTRAAEEVRRRLRLPKDAREAVREAERVSERLAAEKLDEGRLEEARRSLVGFGRWVQAGDVLGFVYDGFDGELRAEIRTPVAGLLSGMRRQPLLCEGDLLARVQTPEEVSEVTDTYLQGQGQ